MTHLPGLVALAIVLLLLAAAFGLGWNWSVAAFTAKQRRLRDQYLSLATRYEELAEMMQQDPTRAGIDIGKQAVVNDIEQLCAAIRAEIERATP